MNRGISLSSPSSNFESIKKVDEHGTEYWEARQLLPILGYEKWQNAQEVIMKATRACMNSGETVENHFTGFSNMVEVGSGAVRQIRDYKLDRYACYLIAQNGVTNFGTFNNEGYRGLYGMNLPDIEKRKNIKKGELLDVASSTELAANLFRITQTDEKIKKDKIRGQDLATRTHFMVGGKVRQTIKDIGGELPESLPTEKHIKELQREKRKQLKKKS